VLLSHVRWIAGCLWRVRLVVPPTEVAGPLSRRIQQSLRTLALEIWHFIRYSCNALVLIFNYRHCILVRSSFSANYSSAVDGARLWEFQIFHCILYSTNRKSSFCRYVVSFLCSAESYRLWSSKEIPWLYYTNSTVIWSLCRTQWVTELWHYTGKPSCFYFVWTKWIKLSHNGDVFSIPLEECFTSKTDFVTSGFWVLNWNFLASLISL
jgi:hypothetical protein